MKPFLVEVAEAIMQNHSRLEEVTVIFPNRRAVLYFRHYLTEKIQSPVWSPKLYSIEDWMAEMSDIRLMDKLDLVHRLFQVHQEVLKLEEPFEQFYFWGDMLLQDFEEVDKYLVSTTHLFRDLRNLKELDASFDFLTEEQKAFLMRFWAGFGEDMADHKAKFVKLWQKLAKIHERFSAGLRKEKMGHGGMLYRDVATKAKAGKLKLNASNMYWVGFNALTKAEEEVMRVSIEQGARVFWDTDAYYLHDRNQEAGIFFRQYKAHPVLGNTFEQAAPKFIRESAKEIIQTAVPNRIGQAKMMVQDLKTVSIESNLERGGNTAIVLADESMLLSVLHALPHDIASINVTMGFPLRNTPMYNLLDLVLDLQASRRGNFFNHHPVKAILNHAYVLELAGAEAKGLISKFTERSRLLIKNVEFEGAGPFLETLFSAKEAQEVPGYLLSMVGNLGAALPTSNKLGKEYAFHFHRILTKLTEVVGNAPAIGITHVERLKAFQKLFRQVVQSNKIPFVGEPLKGVQVMGILETRNLDFENVFILNLNEGAWPAGGRQSSYIPFSLRKAYGLPTFEHTDATYAYLFYRLFQRAKNVYMYYNSEPDVLGTSEMSRFLRQLNIESGLEIKKRAFGNKVELKPVEPLKFRQNARSLEFLAQFNSTEKPLSPTTLNDFIECKLRFYLKHVAGFREADEVEEGLDARVFGTLLHDVLHWMYADHMKAKGPKVCPEDFATLHAALPYLMDRAFQKQFGLPEDEPVQFEGAWLAMKEVILDFALAVLKRDAEVAPLEILSLEEKISVDYKVMVDGVEKSIRLGGKIDRVDKTTRIRIIDYKTGKDDAVMNSVEALFDNQLSNRNKAAFQTMYYATVVKASRPLTMAPIQPGLFHKAFLFEGEEFGLMKSGKPYESVNDMIPAFEIELKKVLGELMAEATEFTQTEQLKRCEYCAFKNLCRR